MIKILKGLFGGGKGESGSKHEAVIYNGYTIQPTPSSTGGGWSTEGAITKEVDGETRTHTFIRADTSTGEEAAVSLIIAKARMLIDQQGDSIFPDPD